MRHTIFAFVFLGVPLLTMSMANAKPIAGPIETGAQLSTACQTFLARSSQARENALVPIDPCRAYLTGFIEAYGAAQEAELESRVTNAAPSPAPNAEKMACFTLPQYLSFHDFAKLVVDFTASHAEYRTKPAYITVAAALAGKYPCQ